MAAYRIDPALRRNPEKLARYRANVRIDHARRCGMCGGPRRFDYIAGGYVCIQGGRWHGIDRTPS